MNKYSCMRYAQLIAGPSSREFEGVCQCGHMIAASVMDIIYV